MDSLSSLPLNASFLSSFLHLFYFPLFHEASKIALEANGELTKTALPFTFNLSNSNYKDKVGAILWGHLLEVHFQGSEDVSTDGNLPVLIWLTSIAWEQRLIWVTMMELSKFRESDLQGDHWAVESGSPSNHSTHPPQWPSMAFSHRQTSPSIFLCTILKFKKKKKVPHEMT